MWCVITRYVGDKALVAWLYFDADVNFSHQRFIDHPDGENYIPLAPTLTSTGGVALQLPNGISGSLRYRYVKDLPANDDNTITAEGYTVADLTLNYTRSRWEMGAQLQNLLNTAWREARFETETRLQNAPQLVTEIHFTPGMPFYAKGHVSFFF